MRFSTREFCSKHGDYYSMFGPTFDCPRCREESRQTEPTPEVRTWPAGTVRPDTPEQSAEKAVVEAAEAWADWWGQQVKGLNETTYERDLFKASLALRATKQPQPVRPSEAGAGALYRDPVDGQIVRVVRLPDGYNYGGLKGGQVFHFERDFRFVLLVEGDQCET